MPTKRIVLLETNEALLQEIREELYKTGRYEVVCSGDDGAFGLEQVFTLKPDLVVVNMFLKGLDGYGVIQKVRKNFPKMKILALGNGKEEIVEMAMSSGADYYFVKPFPISVFIERVGELLKEEENYQMKYPTMSKRTPVTVEEKISDLFISIGIPPHIKGYGYLRDGIKKTVENPKIINNVTKELYPSIAEKFETTPSKVERAIRHAIEVAWNRGRIEAINAAFGTRIYLGTEKPTNSEFIALVADKFILEMM